MLDEVVEATERRKFDKPLDQEVIEKKKVRFRTPIIDTNTGRVSGFEEGEKEVDERVTYTQARLTDSFCRAEDHEFYEIEETPGGYVAKCSKCRHGKFVNPIMHTLKDGKVIIRNPAVRIGKESKKYGKISKSRPARSSSSN